VILAVVSHRLLTPYLAKVLPIMLPPVRQVLPHLNMGMVKRIACVEWRY